MRDQVVICLCFRQNKSHNGGLACSYYTNYSKSSKMNLTIHEKGKNGEHGLFTHSSQSLFPSLLQKLQICSGRCLKILFGFTIINKRRYYTFIASPKIPWAQLWSCLWKLIPEPLTDGNLIVVLDDFINPETGRKIFGCHNFVQASGERVLCQSLWPCRNYSCLRPGGAQNVKMPGQGDMGLSQKTMGGAFFYRLDIFGREGQGILMHP